MFWQGMRNFFFLGSWFLVALFFFFNELPPVKFVIVEKPAVPEGLPVSKAPVSRGLPYKKAHGVCSAKKGHLRVQMPEKWNGYGCRYNFEHDHYSMGIFTCKSQCCASLRNLCANLVPSGKFIWKIMGIHVEVQL